MKDYKYGIPQLKKYPMPDAKHVKSAIKFFNYVDPKYEKQLAKAIISRMKEYKISFDNINIGKDNKFIKYIPDDSLTHYGVLGMKWGIRRYQNKDGTRIKKGLFSRKSKSSGNDFTQKTEAKKKEKLSADEKRYRNIRKKKVSELSDMDLKFALARDKQIKDYKDRFSDPATVDKIEKKIKNVTNKIETATKFLGASIALYKTIKPILDHFFPNENKSSTTSSEKDTVAETILSDISETISDSVPDLVVDIVEPMRNTSINDVIDVNDFVEVITDESRLLGP